MEPNLAHKQVSFPLHQSLLLLSSLRVPGTHCSHFLLFPLGVGFPPPSRITNAGQADSFPTPLSSVQLLSHVPLFATPWTVARQASLSITNSRNALTLMSIELVMPSNYLILLLYGTFGNPARQAGLNTGCPLKGLMLKLKLQYFGHLM